MSIIRKKFYWKMLKKIGTFSRSNTEVLTVCVLRLAGFTVEYITVINGNLSPFQN